MANYMAVVEVLIEAPDDESAIYEYENGSWDINDHILYELNERGDIVREIG